MAMLGADPARTDVPLVEGPCHSVLRPSLVSAGLFPNMTQERMEVDQRSIYVGNVSWRPWSKAHLTAPCPAGRMSEIPSVGVHLPPHRRLAGPIPNASPLPSPDWECASASAHDPQSLADNLLQVSAPQNTPLEAVGHAVLLVPSKGGAISWIWVSRLEHSAGRVS